jgi:hypothetical protein
MATTSALQLALQWREARAARLAAQKQVDLLEVNEKALKKQVMERLEKAKNKAVSNGDRLFQLVTKDEPVADDWPKIYAHIKETGEFELIERRLSKAAVKERAELGEKVPGVAWFPVTNLSDTASKE